MKFKLFETIATEDTDLILYHNTYFSYVADILKNGFLLNKSNSELASGLQMTWAINHPYDNIKNIFDYGGCTIKFKLPPGCRYEQVNNDQFIIYDDIPANCIIDVDYMLGMPSAPIKSSNIDTYIQKYGKDKVKQVLSNHHNTEMTLEELKELTPQLDW